MNLQNLKLAIRPRRDWEAVDLGLLIGQRWWWPMFKVWMILTLPVTIVLSFLPLDWVWLGAVVIWWLKPLFERPLLMIISQGVFGEEPTTRQVLKAFPLLAMRQTFSSLIWRRLSPSRSMDLPIVQLEGLRGGQRAQRLLVLHRDDAAPAKWLTFLGYHIEILLTLGLFLMVLAFIPETLQVRWLDVTFWMQSKTGLILQGFVYSLAMALVAPWYVACGFALYLNRRIKLEGWDIEIAFKRMVQKRATSPSRTTGIVLCLLLGIGLGSTPSTGFTDTNTALDSYTVWQIEQAQAKADIQSVKAQDAFHLKQTITIPKFKERSTETPPSLQRLQDLLNGFFKSTAAFIAGLAFASEIILWGVVIGLIFFLALRYRHWLMRFRRPAQHDRQPAAAKTLFNLQVSEKSLPADISASALQLWHDEPRAALALLYRASLNRLLSYGLHIAPSNTEDECLQSLHQHARALAIPPAVESYFHELTQAWLLLAYGHQAPSDQQGRTLCQSWNRIWLHPSRAEDHGQVAPLEKEMAHD